MPMPWEVFFALLVGAFVLLIVCGMFWGLWVTRDKPYVDPDAKLTREEREAKWRSEEAWRRERRERQEMQPFMDVINDLGRERRHALELQAEGNTIIVPKPECLIPVAGFAEAAKVAAYLKGRNWRGFSAKVEHRVSTEKGKPDQIYVLAQWEVQQ